MRSLPDYRSRVAVYLRKSRMDSDAESIDETLARHEDTLMKLAERLSLNIVKTYKEVVSGDGLFTRPEMLRLLHDIENDSLSAVCCMDIDRLGRSSQKDGGIILEEFKEHGVRIITPSKTYDLSDELDEQSVEMQSFIARQELRSIKRRLRRGLYKTLESGGHVAEPPYGYRRAFADGKPTLKICGDEAAVVRAVFDMYVNRGLGSQAIADRLNAAGLKPRKSGSFSRTTIQFYLKNPVYTGKIVWNRTHRIKKKSFTDKNKYEPNPESEWIISDGMHPAIISQELFDEARRIREARSHPPTARAAIRNPFAGLIRCGRCGAPMQLQRDPRGSDRLICVKKGCNRGIKAEYIEKIVSDAVRAVLGHGEYRDFTPPPRADLDRCETLDHLISAAQRELSRLKAQKNSLHDLLERGVYDEAAFRERSEIIAARAKACENEAANARAELAAAKTENDPQFTRRALLGEYENLSAAEKNAVLKALICSITYLRTPNHGGNTFDLTINWKYLP